MSKRYASQINKYISKHLAGLAENKQGYFTETEAVSWLTTTLPKNSFAHVDYP